MKTKLTLIALAFLLIGCNDKDKKIEDAKLLMDVGMSTYRLELYRAMNKDTTIYLDRLDSLYLIEQKRIIKTVFKNEN